MKQNQVEQFMIPKHSLIIHYLRCDIVYCLLLLIDHRKTEEQNQLRHLCVGLLLVSVDTNLAC